VTLHAITVIGHDRPGIIAQATGALARLGLNLEDITMTLLRGHFTMVLLCEGDVSARRIEEVLEFIAADGTLSVSAREIPEEPVEEPAATPYVVTVHGADRPGIVSAVATRLADVGGNITDLDSRLASGLYILGAEVDLPDGTDVDALEQSLSKAADELGVGATLQPADSDDL
jgi:glycine cleavage system transcriptional repressor